MLSLKQYAMFSIFDGSSASINPYFKEKFKIGKTPETCPSENFIPEEWYLLKKMIPIKELFDQVVAFKKSYYQSWLEDDMKYSFTHYDEEIVEAHITFKTVKTKRIYVDNDWQVLARKKVKKRSFKIDVEDDPCAKGYEWPFKKHNVKNFIITKEREEEVNMRLGKDLNSIKLIFK